MKKLPVSRSENLVVQSADKELLLYDLTINKAYCLNETSAIIFNACDGKTSFDELRKDNNFSDDLIILALDELQKRNLIKSNESFLNGLNRREMVRRAGLASIVALPVISSLIAPTAAHAGSIRICVSGQRITSTDEDRGLYVRFGDPNVQNCFRSITPRCCNGFTRPSVYSCCGGFGVGRLRTCSVTCN